MKKCLVVLALCGALAACSDPVLDGSSEAAFGESMEKASAALSPGQRNQFHNDVAMLAMGSIDFGSIMAGKEPDVSGNMLAQLDGKTAEQVMEEAARVRAERAQRERAQVESEIRELLAKQAGAAEARRQLEQFQVTRSRFFQEPQRFGRPEPIIELDVVNGTQAAISRAYFRGTVASPGRQVPWLSESFNYSIRGGLEPGESASWRLSPNMFSAWGNVSAPDDALFTVKVYRLDGPDGEALYDATGLDDFERSRLKTLQERFGG